MRSRERSRATLARVNAGVLSLLLFFPRLATAEDESVKESAHWLKWTAEAECPTSESIEERLSVWLKGPLNVEQPLDVEASATPFEGSWLVSISLRYGETTGRRDLELSTCEEAADFVAFTVALAVDPELDLGATTGEGGGAEAAFPLETPNNPEKDEAPAPTEESEFSTAPPPDEGTVAVSPQADATKPTEAPNEKQIDEGPAKEPSLPRTFVFGGARGMTGVLPEFALGPSLGLGSSIGGFQISGEAFFINGATYSFDGWPGAARMRFGAAEGKACYLFGLAVPLGVGPCAALQLGAVSAQERDASGDVGTQGGTALWMAFLAGLEAQVRIAPQLALAAGGHVSVPSVRPTFKLDDGTPVFQSSVGFSGQVAFQIFF